MFIDIEYKDLYDPEDICTINRNQYGFYLCNCCGCCDEESIEDYTL